MKPNDQRMIAAALASLAAAFDRELPELTLKLYIEDLSDIPAPSVVAACRELRRTSIHFPRIAEIRSLCSKPPAVDATEKWNQVVALCSNWRAAKHPDPRVESIVSGMGGWQHLATLPTSELQSWRAKDFRDRWSETEAGAHHAEIASAEIPGGRVGDLVRLTAGRMSK